MVEEITEVTLKYCLSHAAVLKPSGWLPALIGKKLDGSDVAVMTASQISQAGAGVVVNKVEEVEQPRSVHVGRCSSYRVFARLCCQLQPHQLTHTHT